MSQPALVETLARAMHAVHQANIVCGNLNPFFVLLPRRIAE